MTYSLVPMLKNKKKQKPQINFKQMQNLWQQKVEVTDSHKGHALDKMKI